MNYFLKFLKTWLLFFGLCENPNFYFACILYKNLENYYFLIISTAEDTAYLYY